MLSASCHTLQYCYNYTSWFGAAAGHACRDPGAETGNRQHSTSSLHEWKKRLSVSSIVHYFHTKSLKVFLVKNVAPSWWLLLTIRGIPPLCASREQGGKKYLHVAHGPVLIHHVIGRIPLGSERVAMFLFPDWILVVTQQEVTRWGRGLTTLF